MPSLVLPIYFSHLHEPHFGGTRLTLKLFRKVRVGQTLQRVLVQLLAPSHERPVVGVLVDVGQSAVGLAK